MLLLLCEQEKSSEGKEENLTGQKALSGCVSSNSPAQSQRQDLLRATSSYLLSISTDGDPTAY